MTWNEEGRLPRVPMETRSFEWFVPLKRKGTSGHWSSHINLDEPQNSSSVACWSDEWSEMIRLTRLIQRDNNNNKHCEQILLYIWIAPRNGHVRTCWGVERKSYLKSTQKNYRPYVTFKWNCRLIISLRRTQSKVDNKNGDHL